MPSKIGSLIQDLRGIGRLAVDATAGVTDLVEALHRNLSPAQATLATAKSGKGRTRGITGIVYRGIRGVTRAAGAGIDGSLSALSAALDTPPADAAQTRARAIVQAALNGVLGDYLVATANPLAIPMRLRYHNAADSSIQDQAGAAPAGKLLILVHGLCMSDLQWLRHDHDHGAALARDLGYTCAYLLYNSGLHVSVNGRLLADLLEAAVRASKTAPAQLVLLGHSMGGLVIRSACHYAELGGHAWRDLPMKIVCMGTPHHGAPLERGGAWVDAVLGATPFLAPFARLGKIRSAGITDLRYGNVVDEDWQESGAPHRSDARRPVPLPDDVPCYAIAATTGAREGALADRLLGDGLVPLSSALGRHPRRSFALRFTHSWTGYRMNHLDLLDRAEVYKQLLRWLGES